MAYNKDVDYSELMEKAYQAGDYTAAAKYEQQRNEKILGEGLNYDTTSKYSKYLEPDSGADSGSDSYNYSAAKTAGRPAYDYSSVGERPTFDKAALATKPVYESRYDAEIDALLGEILNREKFTYDVETDPMYQQYKSMYNREGTRAMNDTLAAAAGGAGGMNSYAMTAAQQANDYYNAQLGDRIPELYNLAYSMYMNDLGAQRDDLNMLQGAERMDYNKYLDSLNQYNNDRNFAYGTYRDSVADWENDRNFAYNQYRDQMSDYRWDTEFDYMKEQDAYANAAAAAKGKTDSSDDPLVYKPENVVPTTPKEKADAYGYFASGMAGSGGGTTPKVEKEIKIQGKPLSAYEAAAGNYQEMAKMCAEVYETQGKRAVLDMLREAYNTGALNQGDYSALYGRYRDK